MTLNILTQNILKILRISVSFICLFLTTISFYGQDKSTNSSQPNLSGVWLLENSTRKIRDNLIKPKITLLVIVHQMIELKVKKVIFVDKEPKAVERIFFTDGRGEKYETTRLSPNTKAMKVVTKSKTKWKNPNELSIENFIQVNAPAGVLPERVYEKWILSENGETLTITFKFFDDNEYKVYKGGDLAPASYEEWVETYKLIPKEEIERLTKNEQL